MKLERPSGMVTLVILVISGCAPTYHTDAFAMRGQSKAQALLDTQACNKQAQQPSFFDQFVLPEHRRIQPQFVRIYGSCMAKIDYIVLVHDGKSQDEAEADRQTCTMQAKKGPDIDVERFVNCLVGQKYSIIGPGNFFRSP